MKLPMTPIPAPNRGFQEKRAFAEPDPQFSVDCNNVVPFDRVEDRLRIGTRPAEFKVFDIAAVLAGQGTAGPGETSTFSEDTPASRKKIQFLGSATVYQSGSLVDLMIVVYDGRVYIADGSDTFIGNGQQVAGLITPVSLSDPDLIKNSDDTLYDNGHVARVQLDDRPFDPDSLVEGVQYFNDFYLVGKKRTGVTLPSETVGTGSDGSRGGTYTTAWVNVKLQPEASGTRPSDSLDLTDRYIMYDYRERDLEDAAQNSEDGLPPDNFTHLSKWGTRLVCTNFADTPTNYIASGVATTDAVLNWSPAAGAENPIFGFTSSVVDANNEPGTLGDNIIFSAPFGEAGLLLGCANSVQFITQDPLFGSPQVRALSRNIGVVGQRAFTYGPRKEIYILHHDGMYGIEPNVFNIDETSSLSVAALGNFFSNVDYSDLEPQLTYDFDMNGVWVWLADNDADVQSTSLYYDLLTQSWWPQTFFSSEFRGAMSNCLFRPFGRRDAPFTMLGSTGGKISTFNRGDNLAYDGETLPGAEGSTTNNGDGLSADLVDLRKIKSYFYHSPIYNPDRTRTELRCVEVDLDINDPDIGKSAKGTLERPYISVRSADSPNNTAAVKISETISLTTNRLTIDGGTDPDAALTGALDGGAYNSTFSGANFANGGSATRPEGRYTVSSTLLPEIDRIYEQEGGKYQIKYDTVWKVQNKQAHIKTEDGTSDPVDEYQFETGNSGFANPPFEAQFITIVPPSGAYLERLTSDFASPVDRVETDLGVLYPGRNEPKRCRIRGGAISIGIRSDSRPFICESVSAGIVNVGPHRSIKSRS